MHFARPAPPRTTKATVRFGSSLSPAVTFLAAALAAAPAAEPVSRLAAEPASRRAGRLTLMHNQEPPAQAGGFFVCAEHVRQVEGESPFHNLMEVNLRRVTLTRT